jgi:hypothetical protein
LAPELSNVVADASVMAPKFVACPKVRTPFVVTAPNE